jgi:hypothetical protein
VDPLLWPGTSGFLLQGKSHTQAIRLLDQFIGKEGANLIKDPVKRAVMQHDLWAVFDWTANTFNPLPFGGRVDPKKHGTVKLTNARKALRQRLAKAITSLALNKREITSLPNNYGQAIGAEVFNTRFEEKNRKYPASNTGMMLWIHFCGRVLPVFCFKARVTPRPSGCLINLLARKAQTSSRTQSSAR